MTPTVHRSPKREPDDDALAAPRDFDRVYTDNHDFVWRNVQRLGIATEAVDDAVQEVFLVVARKLDTFEGRSSIRTWLFAITVRVVKHIQRGRTRHERFRQRLSDVAETHPQMHRHDTRSDAARTLHRLLATLDEPKRHVFILSELEGLTGPEIADALDLTLPAVYARLRAAKIHLEKAAARSDDSETNMEQTA